MPQFLLPPTELQQVLLNLINNAIDSMDGGGELSILARKEDESIVIEVTDTGRGMAEGDLTRVFDPFFTTKPVGKGTGLGLSICYGIIKKMGGEITVKSVLGKGSTFRIRIPAKQDSEGSSPTPYPQ
jgi:two-component system NtrC family sensor kinase